MTERTMAQWAQQALDVQDACNMGGVSKSFAELVSFLYRNRPADAGTEWVNQHPAVKLFADKMADLAHVRNYSEFSEAYDACEKLATDPVGAALADVQDRINAALVTR